MSAGRYAPASLEQVSDWWTTSVTRIAPGEVDYRGVPVQELIGSTDLITATWLLVRGDRPTAGQAALLQAAMVAALDHGPQAPSIAIARMAITCGVGMNNAMASAINTLGDSHGGAGQQCVELLNEVALAGVDATHEVVDRWRQRSRYLPGFGHRFHPRDPRRDPLLSLVADAVRAGEVAGQHLQAALAVEQILSEGRERPVPMNIDGATAVIYAELGFAPELARGFFVLSRSVGILAHAWEERQSGRRNKGPIPPSLLPTFIPPGPVAP